MHITGRRAIRATIGVSKNTQMVFNFALNVNLSKGQVIPVPLNNTLVKGPKSLVWDIQTVTPPPPPSPPVSLLFHPLPVKDNTEVESNPAKVIDDSDSKMIKWNIYYYQ